MRLFLCGGGCKDQIKEAFIKFGKELDHSKPILYVPLAMDKENYSSCKKWFASEIKSIKIDNFDMVSSALDFSNKNLNDYAGVFIGGGNTYKLLNELKQFNNLQKLNDYLNAGGVVFGGSAGAIIFGKNIDACLIDDRNVVNLKDTSGLNLLNDYSLLCHLNKNNLNRNKHYLLSCFIKEKLIYLPEENVIYIHNNKIKLYGTKKYLIFKNQNYYTHSNANFSNDMK